MGWATLDGVYVGDPPFRGFGRNGVGESTIFDQAAMARAKPMTAEYADSILAYAETRRRVRWAKTAARRCISDRGYVNKIEWGLAGCSTKYLVATVKRLVEAGRPSPVNLRGVLLYARWLRLYGERLCAAQAVAAE